MLSLTDVAATKVAEFLDKHERPNALLRVRVVGGGCSGFQYPVGPRRRVPRRRPDHRTERSPDAGGRTQPSPTSTAPRFDYVEDLMGAGFRFNNPNAVSSCGCGESFQV